MVLSSSTSFTPLDHHALFSIHPNPDVAQATAGCGRLYPESVRAATS
jgi:hypothetical protein